jgi:hypothetical protein
MGTSIYSTLLSPFGNHRLVIVGGASGLASKIWRLAAYRIHFWRRWAVAVAAWPSGRLRGRRDLAKSSWLLTMQARKRARETRRVGALERNHRRQKNGNLEKNPLWQGFPSGLLEAEAMFPKTWSFGLSFCSPFG